MSVPVKAHHIETFFGVGAPDTRNALGYRWGWQCFTCGTEADGFNTLAEAEAAGAAHADEESA